MRRLIIVGGDGTAHEAANGLLTSDVRPLPPLAMVPVGTGNDFARLTGTHRMGAEEAVARLATGREVAFDVGEAWGEYFINSLGLGFDAAVASHVPRFRHLWRPLVYPAAVARTYRRFRPIEIRLEADHNTFAGCIFCVEIGIGKSAGGGFFLTPGARPDDGLFDVCLVRPLSHWGFITRMPTAFWGGHTRFKEVTMLQTTRLLLRHDGPFSAHLDGEVRAGGPEMEVQLLPRALPVIVVAPAN
jgi:diacylglycerol kinase (ATP)